MPWYHTLWLVVFVATFLFGTATAGSFLHGVISATFLFAILALVALHQMRSRKERFLERAAQEPPRSGLCRMTASTR